MGDNADAELVVVDLKQRILRTKHVPTDGRRPRFLFYTHALVFLSLKRIGPRVQKPSVWYEQAIYYPTLKSHNIYSCRAGHTYDTSCSIAQFSVASSNIYQRNLIDISECPQIFFYCHTSFIFCVLGKLHDTIL